MPTNVHRFANVEHGAVLGRDVEIGPFCHVGPQVVVGDGSVLESHVSIVGRTTMGKRNRFRAGSVIGGEPQDRSFKGVATRLEIGDDNDFREGVTVNGGGEKEDGVTRIGNRNLLMANSHVAHNCHLFDDTILVNGVLLGGHVHVHDGAIVSGNSVIHHWATIGTLAFVSGGSRVPTDVAPYMLAVGSDERKIVTINLVGMQRAGIDGDTIRTVKRAHRLLYRERNSVTRTREIFTEELDGPFPVELENVLSAIERAAEGKQGRARENPKFHYRPNDDEGEARRAA